MKEKRKKPEIPYLEMADIMARAGRWEDTHLILQAGMDDAERRISGVFSGWFEEDMPLMLAGLHLVYSMLYSQLSTQEKMMLEEIVNRTVTVDMDEIFPGQE